MWRRCSLLLTRWRSGQRACLGWWLKKGGEMGSRVLGVNCVGPMVDRSMLRSGSLCLLMGGSLLVLGNQVRRSLLGLRAVRLGSRRVKHSRLGTAVAQLLSVLMGWMVRLAGVRWEVLVTAQ